MEHTYTTRGTCSRQITFELDGNRVKNIHFVGGCDGNLKAVSKLAATPAAPAPPPAPISSPSRWSRRMTRSRRESNQIFLITGKRRSYDRLFVVYFTSPREAE